MAKRWEFRDEADNNAYIAQLILTFSIPDRLEIYWTRYDGEQHGGRWIYGMVTCGDTFAYACADAEVIMPDEINELESCLDAYGDAVGELFWISKKRNQRPLHPLLDKMTPEHRALFLPFVDLYAQKHPKTGRISDRYAREIHQ